jgi:hypothetical protein
MNKTIVVLANSKKPGGRCLAGKELIQKSNGWEIGSWIRPVTMENSGAVPEYSMSLALGHLPRLLDIIEIPFVRYAPTPDQPENWLLDIPIKPNTWQFRGLFDSKEIKSLIDEPAEIWDDKTDSRRVVAGYPQKMSKPASLYLIKPEDILSISIWSEPNPFEPTKPIKRHRQAIIRYAGTSHSLDIDDVAFADKYYPKHPAPHDPPISVKLKNPKETLVCVSLTPEYRGKHYKIAAAFLEPL